MTAKVDEATALFTAKHLLDNDAIEHYREGGYEAARKALRGSEEAAEEIVRLLTCRNCGHAMEPNHSGVCEECSCRMARARVSQ